MRKAAGTLVTALVLLGGAVAALPGQESFSSGWTFPVHRYRLANGLRVVLSEDPSLPVVSVAVVYGAGTIREQSGQIGLAFLLENLMFQGSANVSPLQHLSFIQKAGGELNANTTLDKALYYETLPSNQLALALWLESDRMRSLAFTPSSIARTEDELREAHLRRLATEPYLESYTVFETYLYPDFAYGHPLLLTGEELKNLTPADVSTFYEHYYGPGNAVLAIVGDIQVGRARELVERYFESIPPGPPVAPPPPPGFDQKREVVRTFKETLLPTPGFHLGYRFLPSQTGDRQTMRILEYLLLRGATSRLNARLLKKDLSAYSFSGGLEEKLGVTALRMFALTNNEVMSDRALRAIMSEIDRLKTGLVGDDELDKAKRLFRMDHLRRLGNGLGRALFLAGAAFDDVPTSELSAELDKHMRVTAQGLNGLASRVFQPQNQVLLNIRNR
jgi:zinc protease